MTISRRQFLEKTGIEVSILAFGSGSRFLMDEDDDEAVQVVDRAIDLGITDIGTAHSCGNGNGDGKNERRLGKVMARRRKEVTPATRARGPAPHFPPNPPRRS